MFRDPEKFRAEFPMLETTIHLASCSQGALSNGVARALAEFQGTFAEYGNPWEHWIERVEEARRGFAMVIGASADEIAIVSCASEGAYQVASGIAWGRRGTIVTSDLEFPSLAHVWLAQRRRGATMRYADTRTGFATAEAYDQVIDDATRLVSVPLITYRHGQRLPVDEIAVLARRRGAQVLIDAYQAAGVEPVDVNELDCDYLVCGATKYLLGLPGLAFLYVRRGTARDLEPELTGWFGRIEPFAFDPRRLDFAPTARRYETGSPPVPAAYGAVAGMELLATTEAAMVAAHVSSLTGHLHDLLVAQGEDIASPAANHLRGPQVALRDHDPDRLARYLADRRIITSPRNGLLRLAVHYYTTESDVDTAARAIARYRTC